MAALANRQAFEQEGSLRSPLPLDDSGPLMVFIEIHQFAPLRRLAALTAPAFGGADHDS